MVAVISKNMSSTSAEAASGEALLPEDLTIVEPGQAPWFTVVIPTRNESGNIEPLLSALAEAMQGAVPEILFVDDSTDDTPDVVRRVARTCGLAVRLLHRPAGQRAGGLGGAVVAGLKHARGSWAVVMDADLQHPADLAAKFVAIGESRRVDLVAGTRHLGTGSTEGLNGGYRKAASGLASTVAKSTFPSRLARLSDPMSGFFAVRLSALDLTRLNPLGFKVLMEIAVRHPALHVAEVPFVFGDRVFGESKANIREGARFARHMARLRFSVFGKQIATSSASNPKERVIRLARFGLVGGSGLLVNSAALWAFAHGALTYHYLIAAMLATAVSTSWNFALTEALVFRGEKPGSLLSRGIKFYLVNLIALCVRLPLLALLVERVGAPLLLSNVLTLMLLFLARFVIADAAIYANSDAEPQPMKIIVEPSARAMPGVSPQLSDGLVSEAASGRFASAGVARPVTALRTDRHFEPGARHLPYRYWIDGIGTIGSHVPLRELEYFRAQWVGNDVDLAIRIGTISSGLKKRAQMTQYLNPPALRYEEHLGRLGANFSVRLGNPIEVTVSPTLAHSPHVLYTNVIEALLRFLAVSRGVVLLHSACLQIEGSGLLLSARTDTGKTGTVLKLLREHSARFLSDDMTILEPTGQARCFPKPLTISHHTLRSVEAGDLTAAEWRRLKVQSRLHSREGRQLGMLLARFNMPIMGVNSLTQRVVPPPKYVVDRLVDCITARTTEIENLFIISRGEHELSTLDFDDTLRTLIENTDDAYGFPPFAQMAPSIVMGEDGYAELRRREETILASALRGITVRGMATPDFSWPERIAALVRDEARSTDRAATARVAGPLGG